MYGNFQPSFLHFSHNDPKNQERTRFPDHYQSTNSTSQNDGWPYVPITIHYIPPNDATDGNNQLHEKYPNTNENQRK